MFRSFGWKMIYRVVAKLKKLENHTICYVQINIITVSMQPPFFFLLVVFYFEHSLTCYVRI